MKKILTIWMAAALVAGGAEEKWTMLLEGDSLDGWTSTSGGKPGDGWKLEDGVLHRAKKAGDLVSKEEFEDFELEFEWKISPKGNSGVKYRLRKTSRGWLGAEYQVIDDTSHPDTRDANRRAAALYDLIEPAADKPLREVGEWNRSRVVVKGRRIEHWLNGEMVLEAETGSEAWEEAKKGSKFSKVEGFAEPGPGRILIQDHNDEVWFRGMKVRKL